MRQRYIFTYFGKDPKSRIQLPVFGKGLIINVVNSLRITYPIFGISKYGLPYLFHWEFTFLKSLRQGMPKAWTIINSWLQCMAKSPVLLSVLWICKRLNIWLNISATETTEMAFELSRSRSCCVFTFCMMKQYPALCPFVHVLEGAELLHLCIPPFSEQQGNNSIREILAVCLLCPKHYQSWVGYNKSETPRLQVLPSESRREPV